MKKILIVDNSTWNIYNFRLPLVKKLAQEGFEVVVLTPVDEYILYLQEVVNIRHIPARHLQPRSKNPIQDLLFLIELLVCYQREKPDLVIHYTIKPNIFGSLAARLCQLKSMAVFTGLGYTFLHQRGIFRLIPMLYRGALERVERVVFYNPDDRDVFVQQKLVKPQQAVIVPGSGVNTRRFKPRPFTVPKASFRFLFIGRLLKDKGLTEYVQAAQSLRSYAPEVSCWVVGDVADANPSAITMEQLTDWIKQQHIRYLGKVMDVRKVIQQADVIVLPSYREGVPRVILEAMAMGKPVITTDAAGCRETVEHGVNGLLVPPRNAEALALAMTTLYESTPTELTRMGAQSRKMAFEKFDEQIIVSHYFTMLRQLLALDPISEPPKRIRQVVF